MLSQILIVIAVFIGYSIGYWWRGKTDNKYYTKIGKLMIEPDGIAWMCVEDEFNPQNLKDDQIIVLQVKHTPK